MHKKLLLLILLSFVSFKTICQNQNSLHSNSNKKTAQHLPDTILEPAPITRSDRRSAIRQVPLEYNICEDERVTCAIAFFCLLCFIVGVNIWFILGPF